MDKIIINNSVMDKLWNSSENLNDVLSQEYNEIIAKRKKENEILANMTPMQMALYDAGVSKSSSIGSVINSGVMTTGDGGDWLFPAYIDTTLKEIINTSNIMNYVVKSTSNVSSMVVQSSYIDLNNEENKKGLKKARVSEGADLPLAKIKIGESAITLTKKGRAVEQTYEAMQTMRIDMFTKHLAYLAQDIVNQEIEDAVDVALKGDGNNNAAKSLGTTATANVITQEEIIKFLFDYYDKTGLTPTTMIADKDFFIALSNMMYDTGNSFGANGRYLFNTPQLQLASINLVKSLVPTANGKNQIILLNDDISLTKHVLNGSMIREYDKNIRNQTRLGTISEITGFSKNLPDGVHTIVSS